MARQRRCTINAPQRRRPQAVLAAQPRLPQPWHRLPQQQQVQGRQPLAPAVPVRGAGVRCAPGAAQCPVPTSAGGASAVSSSTSSGWRASTRSSAGTGGSSGTASAIAACGRAAVRGCCCCCGLGRSSVAMVGSGEWGGGWRLGSGDGREGKGERGPTQRARRREKRDKRQGKKSNRGQKKKRK